MVHTQSNVWHWYAIRSGWELPPGENDQKTTAAVHSSSSASHGARANSRSWCRNYCWTRASTYPCPIRQLPADKTTPTTFRRHASGRRGTLGRKGGGNLRPTLYNIIKRVSYTESHWLFRAISHIRSTHYVWSTCSNVDNTSHIGNGTRVSSDVNKRTKACRDLSKTDTLLQKYWSSKVSKNMFSFLYFVTVTPELRYPRSLWKGNRCFSCRTSVSHKWQRGQELWTLWGTSRRDRVWWKRSAVACLCLKLLFVNERLAQWRVRKKLNVDILHG